MCFTNTGFRDHLLTGAAPFHTALSLRVREHCLALLVLLLCCAVLLSWWQYSVVKASAVLDFSADFFRSFQLSSVLGVKACCWGISELINDSKEAVEGQIL